MINGCFSYQIWFYNEFILLAEASLYYGTVFISEIKILNLKKKKKMKNSNSLSKVALYSGNAWKRRL